MIARLPRRNIDLCKMCKQPLSFRCGSNQIKNVFQLLPFKRNMQSSLTSKALCVVLSLLTLTMAKWFDEVSTDEHKICAAENKAYFNNKTVINVTFLNGNSDHCCSFCINTDIIRRNHQFVCEYLLVPANCMKHEEINSMQARIVSRT